MADTREWRDDGCRTTQHCRRPTEKQVGQGEKGGWTGNCLRKVVILNRASSLSATILFVFWKPDRTLPELYIRVPGHWGTGDFGTSSQTLTQAVRRSQQCSRWRAADGTLNFSLSSLPANTLLHDSFVTRRASCSRTTRWPSQY